MEERKPPDLMHSAAIHLLRRVARVDDESGIGPARLSALSVLVYRGALTLSELANAASTSWTSCSPARPRRSSEPSPVPRRSSSERSRDAGRAPSNSLLRGDV